jgi:hypothetical protein
MIVKRAEASRLSGEKSKQEGAAFLAANGAKEGVVTLPSGLQYKALTTGSGAKPTLEDTVVCQYRLNLVDGTEVDSSYKRGQPFTIPVKSAIKGWTEVLQLMPVGSKWEVFVPRAWPTASEQAPRSAARRSSSSWSCWRSSDRETRGGRPGEASRSSPPPRWGSERQGGKGRATVHG